MRRNIDTIVKISFVVYLAVTFVLLFVRYRGGWWSDLNIWEYAKSHMNLIPFKTIVEYIDAIRNQKMNVSIPLQNLFGNLLLLFPMGLYLPYLFDKINNIKKYILSIVPILFIIEIAQFLTKRGSFDIDDFLLNLTGALIGYLVWRSKPVQWILEHIE